MKKIFAVFCAALLALCVFTAAASADTGPKPSLHISFSGIGDTECWAAVLSEEKYYGPYSALEPEDLTGMEDSTDVFWKLATYRDADGFYFLQQYSEVTGDRGIGWSYYPPSVFKVLLYFPATDSYVVSGIYSRYAFDSYFTFTLSDRTLNGEQPTGNANAPDVTQAAPVLTGERDYDWSGEATGLAARLVLTLLLELGLALCFGYRTKRPLRVILLTNICTQLLLNLALNYVRFQNGPRAFEIGYVLLELAVFAVEAGIYALLLPKRAPGTGAKRGVLYALAANALSFAGGLGLAALLPDLF